MKSTNGKKQATDLNNSFETFTVKFKFDSVNVEKKCQKIEIEIHVDNII